LSFLLVHDILFFYYSQGGLFATYEVPGLRISATVVKEYRQHGWSYLLVALRPVNDIFVLTCEDRNELLDEESEFSQVSFDGPMEVCLGRGPLIPISEASPVSLGPFALFSLPLLQSELLLLLHDLDKMVGSTKCIFSSRDPSMLIDADQLRPRTDLRCSLRRHFTIDDCLHIFQHLLRAPAKFAEITVAMLLPCLDLSVLRPNDCVTAADHGSLLESITGITELPGEQRVVALSRVSAIAGILLLSSREFLTYQLYQTFANLLDCVDSHLATELFHEVVFNVWVWCGSPAFRRIAKHWSLLLTRASVSLSSKTFIGFVVQSHLFINARNLVSDFSSRRFH
jgi:hypothetical protein